MFNEYPFRFVSEIKPERNSSGLVIEEFPQSRYRNVKDLPLNQHGQGPFCCFKLEKKFSESGIYALMINATPVYIGMCNNLHERFGSRGYGKIHPRNCFKGGQSTNCHINNKILTAVKSKMEIELWFYPISNTDERKRLEEKLINFLKPAWNIQLV